MHTKRKSFVCKIIFNGQSKCKMSLVHPYKRKTIFSEICSKEFSKRCVLKRYLQAHLKKSLFMKYIPKFSHIYLKIKNCTYIKKPVGLLNVFKKISVSGNLRKRILSQTYLKSSCLWSILYWFFTNWTFENISYTCTQMQSQFFMKYILYCNVCIPIWIWQFW